MSEITASHNAPGLRAVLAELHESSRARRFADVVSTFKRQRSVIGDEPAACRLAAVALAELGEFNAALAVLEPALRRADRDTITLTLAGRIALDAGQSETAVLHLREAAASSQSNADIWRWLGEAALLAKLPEAALGIAYVHRLRFVDDIRLTDVFIRLLICANRCDEALLEYERALVRWPNHPELGPAFASFVTFEFPLQALELRERVPWRPVAAILTPALVRGAMAMPAFHATDESIERWHQHLSHELVALTELARQSPLRGDERARCLDATMFLAPYVEHDVTELMFAWGNFVEALVAPLREELGLPPFVPPLRATTSGLSKSPVRSVGFVTNRSGSSSAGRIFGSWIDAALEAGLAVHVFALGPADAADAALAKKAIFARHTDEHSRHWKVVASNILAARCDLLIYPECQGSALQQILAGIKLSRLQAAGFGNPVTSGLLSMDYFLSPAEAESETASEHYRELLVRLRDTWSNLEPAPTASVWTRTLVGATETEILLLVAQPMFKWSPSFRSALIKILVLEPSARLLFVQWPYAFSFRAFELMLRDEMSKAGLFYAERVKVCGYLDHSDYLGLLSVADVALDTFGFSGGVSCADAVAMGVPVVTLQGTFLRGRQASALVTRLADHNDVTASVEEFIYRAIYVARLRRAGAVIKSDVAGREVACFSDAHGGSACSNGQADDETLCDEKCVPTFQHWLRSL